MATNKNASSREIALRVLESVFKEEAYVNISLNHWLNHSDLIIRDKHLVTEIVYGTVSRKITLEWYLSHYIKDRDKLEPWVYYLLMLSLYQLLYLEKVPAHAIVHDAVTIAKKRSNKGAEKLVNAVLRRLSEDDLPNPLAIKRLNKRYSIYYSLPVWIVKKLLEDYGQERGLAIMESLFLHSKASIRVSPSADLSQIKQEFLAENSLLSPVGLVRTSGHFAGTEAFEKGLITIQDETSQLVAPTLSLKGDERVLDACAAPGGKTTHIASYLRTGQVVAMDLYDHKLDLIAENAERLGVADRIKTQKGDATRAHELFPTDYFDKIVVDAPCSGIGLIRRKPDIRYQKKLDDLRALQTIQLEILNSVCQTLRKGGIITYSTCTLFDEENKQVLQKFLETHPNFEAVSLEHNEKSIVTEGCFVITPELYQTDGFFIGQVKRIL